MKLLYSPIVGSKVTVMSSGDGDEVPWERYYYQQVYLQDLSAIDIMFEGAGSGWTKASESLIGFASFKVLKDQPQPWHRLLKPLFGFSLPLLGSWKQIEGFYQKNVIQQIGLFHSYIEMLCVFFYLFLSTCGVSFKFTCVG